MANFESPILKFDDRFVQISQFYVDKAGKAQKKYLEVNIKAKDIGETSQLTEFYKDPSKNIGNDVKVGKLNFDLSPYIN